MPRGGSGEGRGVSLSGVGSPSERAARASEARRSSRSVFEAGREPSTGSKLVFRSDFELVTGSRLDLKSNLEVPSGSGLDFKSSFEVVSGSEPPLVGVCELRGGSGWT